ncbi:MAG: DUF4203 domain-containing protein [Desertimonas sp.]
MTEVIVGLLAIVVGVAFCWRGYVAMRVLIPIWGMFAGFVLGAGLVAGTSDDGFLRTTASWVVGIIVALVFGILAYLYYQVSVVLAMATVGFALGTAVLTAFGVSWSWLIVLAGVVVGLGLAVLAVRADVPAVLLIVLTALGGASVAVFGVMLVAGTIDVDQLERGSTTERAADNGWWYLLYVAIAVVGVVAQVRQATGLGSARQQWGSETMSRA